ncbi:MAG: P1 family peptidase [Chloroflexi bacterium]|nr:P1 family peptidase [Chloroflexota bacterium]
MTEPRDAITDVHGIRVGHWTDRRAATGCTVLLCPPGTVGGVDVRGAAPGTRETELLRPGNMVEEVHALVLAGGSAYGLDAAAGVMRYLAERGVGFRMRDHVVPIVPAAILFDLGIGRPAHPDADAGYRAARRATAGAVAEGSVGAGTGATVAKAAGHERLLKGGLGSASERMETGVVVGALAAVNAVGAIRDPRTAELVAAPRAGRRGFLDVEAIYRAGRRWHEPGEPPPPPAVPEHTTLGVVATNARLTKTQANRLATVAHDALARTIWPVHAPGDGDVVFALATGEAPLVEEGAYGALEAMATLALERAILRGVRLATGLAGVPSAGEWLRRRRR